MSLHRYKLAKVFVIGETALTIPLSTFIGCSYGMGEVLLPSVLLAFQTCLTSLSMVVYLWMLEGLTRK